MKSYNSKIQKHKYLVRERINQKLSNILYTPLFVISAPSGYGKTLAAKIFFKERMDKTVWISLYESGDKHYFWDRLLGALETAIPDIYSCLGMLNMPIVDDIYIAKALESLDGLHLDESGFIVIDDFHNINDDLILKFIKGIARKNINNLHIVIITRETKLDDFNDIVTIVDMIGTSGLRFTMQELNEYAGIIDVPITKKQSEMIMKMSNGWIAGVYLLLRGLKDGIDIKKNRDIHTLVRSVIYNSYDESIKSAMLRLSFLDRYSSKQAGYILNDVNFDRLLYKIYGNDAFIHFDEMKDEYIIHNVLLTFLRHERKRMAIDMKKFYKRAGEWSFKHNDYLEMYKFYCLAQEKEELLEKASQMLQIDNYYELPDYFVAFFEELEKEDYYKYPLALIDAGLLLMLNNDKDKQMLGGKIIVIMQILAKRDKLKFGELADRVLGETYLIGLFLEFNNIKKIYTSIIKAEEYLEDNQSFFINHKSELPFEHTHILHTFYKKQGELKETMNLCADIFHRFSAITDGFAAGIEYVVQAEYYLETGDFEKAEINAYKAIFMANSSEQLLIELCAVFTLLRLNILKGNKQDFYSLLKDIDKKIGRKGNDYYYIPQELIEGYIYASIGMTNKTASWLRGDGEYITRFMNLGMGYTHIVRAKILIANKDFHKLEVQIQLTQKACKEYNNQLGFIHNQIHAAICDYKHEGIKKARKSMKKALKMGEEDAIIMPFAEYAQYVLEILAEVEDVERTDYIKKIIKTCKMYQKGVSVITKSDAFTNREIEVIKLSAKGMNREEICREIFVSVHTVKKHLLTIYKKLDCRNKVEMVEKAKKAGIV